jgi:class 3 adenylate cyclase
MDGAAERRQVTVLFADMAGFTTISERLGEEGTYALIQPIYQLMATAVNEQGGSVKDFTGDGIMALFGVPHALEDGPLRACRAALLIQQRLLAVAPDIEARHGIRPQMRIGINTGPAVVAQVRDGTSATALGDTVNLASRLQSLAEPGNVLLSEATLQLVQGLVETTPAGEHRVKGKAEPQKVYRLNAVREGAARFDAALSRGLTTYVGRARELKTLARALDAIGSRTQVIDLVGEPGIGKSRLLHEFRTRHTKEAGVFILAGSCSPDGRQSPFLPFIEVIRGAFQVRAGEADTAVAENVAKNLKKLGLDSAQNRGLVLNLLGIKVPEGALKGLDGVLIGLRTRELLWQWLEAYCALLPVLILLEDLHWIDSASEQLLAKIVASEEPLRLLVIYTRRPEYRPPWAGNPRVTLLPLERLTALETSRIVQARFGADDLPEGLAKLVADRAEGNALFAEEIASFLQERRVVRRGAAGLEFDAAAAAGALPASVQTLLTARIDSLLSEHRKLLQAAAVIGRRFDPELLAAVVRGPADLGARLAPMCALDLIDLDSKSGDYTFKHALVRDALYQSLLTGPRAALHLSIAEEIERRSGNRLAEVAEILAHHYQQTERADKAFTYLAMAGAKSLSIYSLDEAETHFTAAAALLDKDPDCAMDNEVVDFLVNYSLLLNLVHHLRELIPTVERYRNRVDRLGDDRRTVLILHQRVTSLVWMGRYREAATAQDEISAMADRLGDDLSRAYSAAGAILVSRKVWPMRAEQNEPLGRTALAAAARTNDPFIQTWLRWIIAIEALDRGRIIEARSRAGEMITIGQRLNDPRPIGFGLNCLAWIENVLENYQEALRYSEETLKVAVTTWDRMAATYAKAFALVMLRRPEGVSILEAARQENRANGQRFIVSLLDLAYAFSLILQGRITRGIRWMKQIILDREEEGFQLRAEWYRILLCQVYLEIIAGKEKPPFSVLARNLPTLLWVKLFGPAQIRTIMARVRPFFSANSDPDGSFLASCEMILGLLDKAQRKNTSALKHLNEAKRIASQFGQTPMLARIETALADFR